MGEPAPPQTAFSSRASSPRSRRLAAPASSPISHSSPRGSSRGASSPRASSSAGSMGNGGLGGTSSLDMGGLRCTGTLMGTTSRPGTAGSYAGDGSGSDDRKQDMLQKGYLPTEEYIGIMAYNKELFTQNKHLRAE